MLPVCSQQPKKTLCGARPCPEEIAPFRTEHVLSFRQPATRLSFKIYRPPCLVCTCLQPNQRCRNFLAERHTFELLQFDSAGLGLVMADLGLSKRTLCVSRASVPAAARSFLFSINKSQKFTLIFSNVWLQKGIRMNDDRSNAFLPFCFISLLRVSVTHDCVCIGHRSLF